MINTLRPQIQKAIANKQALGKQIVAIEIDKARPNCFSLWDSERVKNAFNFGNGEVKHLQAYADNNKRYLDIFFVNEKGEF